MSETVIIFPFGGNAKEALAAVLHNNKGRSHKKEVLGFIDDDVKLEGGSFLGVKVLGGKEKLKEYPGAKILAVPGSPGNFHLRKKMIGAVTSGGNSFTSVIHDSAQIAEGCEIGENVLILANVVIGAGARVGSHCVILPNTVVGHDSIVSDHCVIGANVTVSGGVNIAENCYIGSSSSIKEYIKIGKMCLVGIGANVLTDVEDNMVVAGNPARALRKVTP